MAATVSWIEDQKILCIRYEEPVHVDDILHALDQITALLDPLLDPVNLIVDLTDVRRIPANMISSYPRIYQHPGVRHRRLDHSYVVIDNYALTSVIGIFDRLFAKFQIVRTLEDAQRLIDAERTSQSEAPEE
jgi:hypothetical protein